MTSTETPRVLVVDDAPAIRSALRGVLEDAGMLVVGEAPDGAQGVAMTGSLRPDVVLMDLRMPWSDGFQATEQIVVSYPEVQVVVLSAYEILPATRAKEESPANRATPLLCCHGRFDPLVPVARGRQAYEAYARGRTAEWHDSPMAHEVSLDEIGVIKRWLHARFGSPPPAPRA